MHSKEYQILPSEKMEQKRWRQVNKWERRKHEWSLGVHLSSLTSTNLELKNDLKIRFFQHPCVHSARTMWILQLRRFFGNGQTVALSVIPHLWAMPLGVYGHMWTQIWAASYSVGRVPSFGWHRTRLNPRSKSFTRKVSKKSPRFFESWAPLLRLAAKEKTQNGWQCSPGYAGIPQASCRPSSRPEFWRSNGEIGWTWLKPEIDEAWKIMGVMGIYIHIYIYGISPSSDDMLGIWTSKLGGWSPLTLQRVAEVRCGAALGGLQSHCPVLEAGGNGLHSLADENGNSLVGEFWNNGTLRSPFLDNLIRAPDSIQTCIAGIVSGSKTWLHTK